VAQLVQALRYKPKGCGFDSGRCRWNFSLTYFWPHYGPGVDSASNRNEYQDYFLGGKSGRCVGLTPLPPSCAEGGVIKSGSLNLPEPSGPVMGLLYLFTFYYVLQIRISNACFLTSASDFLNLEDGNEGLSRNVGKELRLYAGQYPRRVQNSTWQWTEWLKATIELPVSDPRPAGPSPSYARDFRSPLPRTQLHISATTIRLKMALLYTPWTGDVKYGLTPEQYSLIVHSTTAPVSSPSSILPPPSFVLLRFRSRKEKNSAPVKNVTISVFF